MTALPNYDDLLTDRLSDEPEQEMDELCPDCGGPAGPDCHPGHVAMDEAEESLFASLMCTDFQLVCRICDGSGQIAYQTVPSLGTIRCPCTMSEVLAAHGVVTR